MPVRERRLVHGDRIRAGDSVLLFLQAGTDEGEAQTPGRAADDRSRLIAPADLPNRASSPLEADAPEAIVAEVLAGRIALQAHDMVGDSAPMRDVYERIRKVAQRDSTVLICGETGTGKELAARAIHQNSGRAARPFVAVNCAALTEALLESELFGHEKGAFTGAVATKKGKFEVADRGTIFLDEIGELAPALQTAGRSSSGRIAAAATISITPRRTDPECARCSSTASTPNIRRTGFPTDARSSTTPSTMRPARTSGSSTPTDRTRSRSC
jgi:hypothetical protein